MKTQPSYSRQQFEEELVLAVVGGQRVVSGDRVLDHQVADQGNDELGAPVTVTRNQVLLEHTTILFWIYLHCVLSVHAE